MASLNLRVAPPCPLTHNETHDSLTQHRFLFNNFYRKDKDFKPILKSTFKKADSVCAPTTDHLTTADPRPTDPHRQALKILGIFLEVKGGIRLIILLWVSWDNGSAHKERLNFNFWPNFFEVYPQNVNFKECFTGSFLLQKNPQIHPKYEGEEVTCPPKI